LSERPTSAARPSDPRSPVTVPGGAREGPPRAERRRVSRDDVPEDACLVCGDDERLAPEPLVAADDLDEDARRGDVLLCHTCAATQRGATQRLWWLGLVAQLGVAAVVVTALSLWPQRGLVAGAALLGSLVVSARLLDAILRRARERAVPLAWLDADAESITLQVPTWDPRGEPPAHLDGVSGMVPIFLVSLVAFIGGWVVWHSITPVVTLDNPSNGACVFHVDDRAWTVPATGRETVRVRAGEVALRVECPDGAHSATADLQRRLLFSSRDDVCYARREWAGNPRRGPVVRVPENALRVPCP
jgi:hypothetical protein